MTELIYPNSYDWSIKDKLISDRIRYVQCVQKQNLICNLLKLVASAAIHHMPSLSPLLLLSFFAIAPGGVSSKKNFLLHTFTRSTEFESLIEVIDRKDGKTDPEIWNNLWTVSERKSKRRCAFLPFLARSLIFFTSSARMPFSDMFNSLWSLFFPPEPSGFFWLLPDCGLVKQ